MINVEGFEIIRNADKLERPTSASPADSLIIIILSNLLLSPLIPRSLNTHQMTTLVISTEIGSHCGLQVDPYRILSLDKTSSNTRSHMCLFEPMRNKGFSCGLYLLLKISLNTFLYLLSFPSLLGWRLTDLPGHFRLLIHLPLPVPCEHHLSHLALVHCVTKCLFGADPSSSSSFIVHVYIKLFKMK